MRKHADTFAGMCAWRTTRFDLAQGGEGEFVDGVFVNNAEMTSLKRFEPEYFTMIQDWLAKRIGGFRASR